MLNSLIENIVLENASALPNLPIFLTKHEKSVIMVTLVKHYLIYLIKTE